MQKRPEGEETASGLYQNARDDAGRHSVFMQGLLVLAVLLIPYVLAQVAGYFFVDNVGYINGSVFVFSIILDLSLCGFLFYTHSIFRRKKAANSENPDAYGLMIIVTVALFVASLMQIHLVGSQNSLHQLLIVAILLVVIWFFQRRDVIMFFVLGNLGLALLVMLEVKGVLSYAPLFTQNAKLAEIFLDWRAIFGQSINYLLVLIVSTVMICKLRGVLEHSEKLRTQSNEALRREIDQKIRSEREKEELIKKLESSLDDVKTLRGLLPICMHCKKIRDDKGYWQKLESYFKEHSPELTFSHGLCPDCAKEYYAEELDSEQ